MKNIIIIGSGGMGRETCWLIEEINLIKKEWNILGFLDDNVPQNEYIGDYLNLGSINSIENYSDDIYFIIAIGKGRIREELLKRMGKRKFATLIHPTANIAKSSVIGEGTIICSGAVVSIDTQIGNHTIINFNSIVAHDSEIDDFVTVHVNVNISGNVKIGKYSTIGSGVAIYQGKKIGEDCMIGIGSAVLKNIKNEKVALGVPAEIF